MNWSSGWERPPAGPGVNKQFTVANQIFFYRQHSGDNRNRYIAADDTAVPCE